LVVSAGLAGVSKFVGGILPFPAWMAEVVNVLISILVITGIFAVIFKFLPSVRVLWRDVWVGAIFTAVLFTLGKTLIGIYLGRASIGSSYGAAGSLVLILVWIYYSAQIFFMGAEFTRVYATEHGSHRNEEPAAEAQFSGPLAEPAVTGSSHA
ncbi:MAG: YihY/virulence factor BrkB family protein, partial [Acidobacteriota bacterium]|nr:YihY/virulence factor BrkB family protein [Acidobacteriota bacterium]